MNPTLVILAAGIGSRYGGIKQMDPVGPNSELIIDYSVFDAIEAGFGKVVFVIRKDIEKQFRESIGNTVSRFIDTDYAFQSMDDIPAAIPCVRTKPWGTGHAVYSARKAVKEPFAVINADDFYGRDAYHRVCGFLRAVQSDNMNKTKSHICMAGYAVENTLTDNGHVSRAVCSCDKDGYLTKIVERLRIEKKNDSIIYTEKDGETGEIPTGSLVSLNFWGFPAGIPDMFEELLEDFIKDNIDKLDSAEFHLPKAVDLLVYQGKADVQVLRTTDKWYGMTYREDKESVKSAINYMIKCGKYPERLWK